MEKQQLIFEDLGIINYKAAWDYQEELVKKNLDIKSEARNAGGRGQEAVGSRQLAESSQKEIVGGGQLAVGSQKEIVGNGQLAEGSQKEIVGGGQLAVGRRQETVSSRAEGNFELPTLHHLLFCEHPPVYTLGKSGHMENVLLNESEMGEKEIEFFRTNRGGDITFHGLQQIVGYPILDLEKFYTDIGKYLRSLEEVIILTIAAYGIKGERSKGETGVWIEPGIAGKERKICAMGIRCSRWITMHGFALNVNTDLSFFNNIIPCGIVNKQVTSIEKELGCKVDFEEAKQRLKKNFALVFDVIIE